MKRKGWLLLVLGIVFLVQTGGIAWSQVTERVSVDTTGSDADSGSSNPSTSANGSYVAFQSDATDLVPGGSNGSMHTFVRDRQTGTTTQVSVDSAGNETLNPSRVPSISGDGMHVAFESDANLDLVAGDTNPFSDIFVRDLLAVTTTLVSVDSTGAQDLGPSVSPSVSSDGRYVAFQSEADLVLPDNGFIDIYVHDRDADEDGIYDEAGSIATVRVSVDAAGIQGQGNNHSYVPSISGDGRYVAFESIATDLVPGGSNGLIHIFVHDRDADDDGIYDEVGGISTVQVSVNAAGTEGDADSSAPSISADGRYVAFVSNATNLVPGGSDGSFHIFVHDRDADDDGIYDEVGGISTVQVSVDAAGTEGDAGSSAPSISTDGRYVAFASSATNLVPGGSSGLIHIFVHDRDADGDGIYDDEDGSYDPGEVSNVQVSVDSDGVEGNGNSNSPSMSADGKSVIFESDATNLLGVGNDNNGAPDIFADDLQAGAGQNEANGNSSGGCFIATAAYGAVW
jgi:Tol biopolymer transport system component